jgi:hypothetical protein
MRKLSDCEIFNEVIGKGTDVLNTVNQQLYNNIGVIAPEHIETALMDLRTRSKKSTYYAFLADALALYEQRGLVRLFNVANANGGRSRISASIPFIPGVARNRYKEGDEYNNGKDTVVYVNMYRLGNWSADEKTYTNVSVLTDLYTSLESGVIAYKTVVQHMSDKLFSDKTVLEYLTKIYVHMFSLAMQKTKTTYGGSDFQNDAAHFLIAKFFLLYALQKPDSSTVDDYAYLAIKNRSSLEALKSFEEINQINYDTLSGFLKTFGEAFYNGQAVRLSDFENRWVQCFGDSTGFAVEYVPYLLHFLFAAMHGANLGGSLRLTRQYDTLNKLGLPRLYNAVVNVLK